MRILKQLYPLFAVNRDSFLNKHNCGGQRIIISMKIACSLLALFGPFMVSAQATLYYNGKIFTCDSSLPEATYLVVENGLITKTGNDLSELDLKNYPVQIDIQSKRVIPGIVDSHIHFIDGGLGLLQVNFSGINDKAKLVEKINVTKTELLDGMYIGRNLGNEPLKETPNPLKLLDELMPETPTIIFLKSGHAAIINSAALKKLGFDKNTTITDGTLQKDAAGNLTGLLLESASMEANRLIGSAYSNETIQKAIAIMQSKVLSYGITTIGDNTFNPYYFKIYQGLQINNLLKVRVRARSYGRIPQTEGLMKGVGKKHLGFIGKSVDESRVKYHAMKFFEDQSLSYSGYQHDAAKPGGKVFLNEKQLKDIFQINPTSTFAFHVQGKEGLQNILNTINRNNKISLNRRHVIDHAGYASVQQIQEAADLGLGVTIIASQLFDYKNLSSFYKTHSSADQPFEEKDLLDARVKYQFAKGALTSDYPYGMDTLFANYTQVDGLNPFSNMAVNVTGRYPSGELIEGIADKTLTINEAIEAYTLNGAYVLNEDRKIGKIAPGYYADFSVLEEDPLLNDSFALYNTRVSQTYINGALVFDISGNVDAENTTKTIKVSPTDYTISPVIGYDPALGIILGGAYFNFPLKTPGRYFDTQLQVISGGKLSLQSSYTYFDLFRNVNFNLYGSYSNFFQYYFGEGSNTIAENYTRLFFNTYRIKPEIAFILKNKFQIVAFGDARGRKETKAINENDVELNQQFFPNENPVGIGLTLKQDTRDNTFSTKKGTLKQITFLYTPSVLNASGLGEALQIDAEIRYFQYVINSNFVIASRLAAGFSQGTPSYLFRYSLGGSYALRGYYSNRFRGEKYYVGQLEARMPIYKRFSGVTFLDAGDVTDDDFIKPKYTYGAGIRFALSQNIKLRLDYGIAKDQNGIFFTFSEAF